MDPDATLNRIRDLIGLIQIASTASNHYVLSDLAEELAESVESLDDWLSNGGFAPEPWAASWPRPSEAF